MKAATLKRVEFVCPWCKHNWDEEMDLDRTLKLVSTCPVCGQTEVVHTKVASINLTEGK